MPSRRSRRLLLLETPFQETRVPDLGIEGSPFFGGDKSCPMWEGRTAPVSHPTPTCRSRSTASSSMGRGAAAGCRTRAGQVPEPAAVPQRGAQPGEVPRRSRSLLSRHRPASAGKGSESGPALGWSWAGSWEGQVTGGGSGCVFSRRSVPLVSPPLGRPQRTRECFHLLRRNEMKHELWIL